MTQISRYILKAHIGPFLFAFLIITFILVMDIIFEIVNLIIGKNLGIFIVLEIFALNLAWIVAVSIPMASRPLRASQSSVIATTASSRSAKPCAAGSVAPSLMSSSRR